MSLYVPPGPLPVPEKHPTYNLWLHLVHFVQDDGRKGYSFAWEDRHGRIWCSGWVEGSAEHARREAFARIKEER